MIKKLVDRLSKAFEATDAAEVSAESVAVRFNNTETSYTGTTITAGEVSYTFEDLAASSNLQSVTITGLRANVGDFVFLGGDFAFERITVDSAFEVRAVADNAFASRMPLFVRIWEKTIFFLPQPKSFACNGYHFQNISRCNS